MGRRQMISESRGNLLEADVDALVNTVNTVGVMGKGIALQFKRAYPAMFTDYERASKAGDVRLGHMHVWPTGAMTGPRYVINFPTKAHWRAGSQLRDIEAGLRDLVRVVDELGITSLAVPPLGCGNGGLDWLAVEPRIRQAFDTVPDVDVVVFPPGGAPNARAMRTGTPRPAMTPGRAALTSIINRYTQRSAGVSMIEVQKLMYFLQVAGETLQFDYVKGIYGPDAEDLRHTLTLMEGHYVSGFEHDSSKVLDAEPLQVLHGAEAVAAETLDKHPETTSRIDRVLELVEGFESAYGLELLASVHWISQHAGRDAATPEDITRRIHQWPDRESRMFTAEHVCAAGDALATRGWCRVARAAH